VQAPAVTPQPDSLLAIWALDLPVPPSCLHLLVSLALQGSQLLGRIRAVAGLFHFCPRAVVFYTRPLQGLHHNAHKVEGYLTGNMEYGT